MNTPIIFAHGLILGVLIVVFVWMLWDNRK